MLNSKTWIQEANLKECDFSKGIDPWSKRSCSLNKNLLRKKQTNKMLVTCDSNEHT